MPIRITTYDEAFEMLGIKPNDKIKGIIARLAADGRSEKSICFAIWKSQNKIRQFRGDTRFYSVLENEIKKWSWGKDDPRWIEYNKRKAEEEKAKAYRKELMKQQREKEMKWMERRKKCPGFIYFIQGSSGGAIKIGYAKDVSSRLKSLQTGYPDTLILLCMIPGSTKTEKYLHDKFANHRLHGEWFKPSDEILEFINQHKIENNLLQKSEGVKARGDTPC